VNALGLQPVATFQPHIPWFMFDLTNQQLITTRYIPGDISDIKSIIYTETPIPGLNYQPVSPGGGGNRKISFTLPLIYKTASVGDLGLLKQFDMLRNRSKISLPWGTPQMQFDSTPQALYNWGIGSVPLVYWVTKCDEVHKTGWVNQFGNPQYSEIEIELVLDESNPLYLLEEAYRMASAVLGMAQGLLQ
jgi:hypothetical protein